MTRPIKLCMHPYFGGEDAADGGVRRVVEAMTRGLPAVGIELVTDYDAADIYATHIINHLPEGLRGTKPMVAHNHGLYWSEYEWLPWAHAANVKVVEALCEADAITGPSEWVSQILRHGFMKDVFTVHHGVDIEEWEPNQHAGTAPYVYWNKTRADSVCDPSAMIKLARMRPDVEFWSTLGSQDGTTLPTNLTVTGPVPYEQGKHTIMGAGVYLATTRETFGIGTLEAMASGVPVLGWAWGGQRDIVRHGIDGWLCAPGDFNSLAEGLEFCLHNRLSLGKAARDRVAGSFTWSRAMEQYAALYAQVLDVGRSSLGAPSPSPRVSVVITCYALERFLRGAIESVAVNLPGAEVIVVDDCSPGDTSGMSVSEIVSEFRDDPRLEVHSQRTPENLYLAGALNYGIEKASAPLIIPLDADNEIGSGMALCVEALERDRRLGIAYGAMRVLDMAVDGGPDAGGVIKDYVSTWPGEFNFPAQITGHNQIPSTSVYRKSIWARVGGYRSRCRTAEDADFWCRATSYASARRITDAITLVYRNRLDSMSHTVADWPWQAWYSWSRKTALTPLGASLTSEQRRQFLKYPTFEPTLISVIIPVGPGHQRYLADAIDSVIAQTLQQWELIIVNDTGEPLAWVPPFAKLIDEFEPAQAAQPARKGRAARPAKPETRKGGQGTARARNQGLGVASGRTFLFLDADDYLQPTALASLYAVWREPAASGGGGIVFGDFYEQPDTKLHEWDFDTTGVPDPNLVRSKSYIPITFLGPMSVIGQDRVWFDEGLAAWEDWDFLWQLHAAGVCATYVKTPVFNYRYDTGKRRQAMVQDEATVSANKTEMARKWGKYLSPSVGGGGEQLMACGGCRGGGGTPYTVSGGSFGQGVGATQGVGAPAEPGSAVRIAYVGLNVSTVPYRGPVSGESYRFGANASARVNNVRAEDAPHFLALPDFIKHEADNSPEAEPLVAVGR